MEHIYYCQKCNYFYYSEIEVLNSNISEPCPKCQNTKTVNLSISADEWDNLTDEERNKIKEDIREKHMLRCLMFFRPFTNTVKAKWIEGNIPKPNVSKYLSTDSIYLGYTIDEWCKLSIEQQEEIKENIINSMSKMNVSTADSTIPYEIVGPVYYQINNRGLLSNEVILKIHEYADYFEDLNNMLSNGKNDFGWLYGNYSVGENYFDRAFYIAVEELKKRAVLLGADAIICMRQDIDIETERQNNFYLQMYGTAIKYKK